MMLEFPMRLGGFLSLLFLPGGLSCAELRTLPLSIGRFENNKKLYVNGIAIYIEFFFFKFSVVMAYQVNEKSSTGFRSYNEKKVPQNQPL